MNKAFYNYALNTHMSLATACLSVCKAGGHPPIKYSVDEGLCCEAGEYMVHSSPCHYDTSCWKSYRQTTSFVTLSSNEQSKLHGKPMQSSCHIQQQTPQAISNILMSRSWGKLAPHISLAKPYATSVAYSPNLCTFHTHCTRLGNTLYHLSNNAGNGATLDSFQGSRPASLHFPLSAFEAARG